MMEKISGHKKEFNLGLIKDIVKKPDKVSKERADLMLMKQDVEFLLLTIKNSMISGATLEQAVITVQKLQNIYKRLVKLEKS